MSLIRSLSTLCGSALLPLLVASALFGAAPVAVAAPTTGPAAASAADPQQLFTDALAHFDRGDFTAALPIFRQALDASGSPNAGLYVARCLRELGRTPEAYDQMYATTRDATARAGKDPKYAQTRDSAAAELALLEPKVGKVLIVWTGSQEATITLDGRAVSSDRLGAPITVVPGEHVVTATAGGGGPVEQRVTIDGGSTKSVTLTAAAGHAPPQPATKPVAPAEPAAAPEASSGGAVRVAGFVVAGLGVAGMVLFGVAGAQAQSKFSTLEDECGSTRCADPAYADVIDSGKSWELVANVSLGVGITAIAGGVAMIIFGGPTETEEDAAPDAAEARRLPEPRWALDVGSVPGAGATVGTRLTF